MGGTSTDVSRYGGYSEHVFESTTAGVTIQVPQLDINTVAAGGGSILFWRNGLFAVGPESASSHPGPACYRKGGPLTVTDANLFLGRLIPDFFPKIFGPKENQSLDADIARKKFTALTDEINKETGQSMIPEEVACGFLDVANEAMCRPIRALTEGKGYDITMHRLSVFGGAGGQHACEIARKLGISKVIIHKYSSILSAYGMFYLPRCDLSFLFLMIIGIELTKAGMALADVVQEAQEPVNETYSDSSRERLDHRLYRQKGIVRQRLIEQGIQKENISYEMYMNMRYQGTETSTMVLQPEDGDFKAEFQRAHLREFAFVFPDSKPIFVDDVRVRGIGASGRKESDGQGLEEELRSSKFTTVPVETSDRTVHIQHQ